MKNLINKLMSLKSVKFGQVETDELKGFGIIYDEDFCGIIALGFFAVEFKPEFQKPAETEARK